MRTVSAYWRPLSIEQAFELLDRPDAVVLGGGTKLQSELSAAAVEVVDLQALQLDGIVPGEGDALSIGSMTTLQQVADSDEVPAVVRDAARREQPSTLRTQATVGGCIATGDPESELLAVLLVHEAVVRMDDGTSVEERPLDAVLARLPLPASTILLGVTIATSGVAAVSRTARTRADKAIVAAAGAPGRRRAPHRAGRGGADGRSWWNAATISIRSGTSADPASIAEPWPRFISRVSRRRSHDGHRHQTQWRPNGSDVRAGRHPADCAAPARLLQRPIRLVDR